MEERVRIRLLFEDSKVLSKSQRSQGLQCCWILLRPDLHTISALSSFILDLFQLHRRCSNGLILSMDDFVLPQCETTGIFIDKDIVRVRKMSDKQKIVARPKAGAIEDASFQVNKQNLLCSGRMIIYGSDERLSGSGKKNNECLLIEPDDLAGPSHEVHSLKRKRNMNSKFHTSKNYRLAACEEHKEEKSVTDDTRKPQSRNARRKKDKRLRKQTASRKDKDHSPELHSHQDAFACQNVEQCSCSEDEIVPVVVGPGHIRFQALRQSSDVKKNEQQPHGDGAMCQVKTCEKSKEENSKEVSSSKPSDTAAKGELHDMDFENLSPLTCLPKEGDVVAYRLVELASVYPEFSNFRVGQVSFFDPVSMQATLIPVPGYKISLEREFSIQTNISLYKEDGSLEIDFLSLVDVRLVREQNSDVTAANIAREECNNAAGQSRTWSWGIETESCQKMNISSINGNNFAGNSTNSSGKLWQNWHTQISANYDCDMKVANPTSDSMSSLAHEDWPAGCDASCARKTDDGNKISTSENRCNLNLDWDKFKDINNDTEATVVEGWPEWKAREYLANTSWSFFVRAPLLKPSKKRKARYETSVDGRSEGYGCKGQ